MGCFIPPFLNNGEHLFDQASPFKIVLGPFTVRADGIKQEAAARQYVAQVAGVVRGIETTSAGRALVSSIAGFKKQVLIFPLVQVDDDGKALAWTDPRMGLFAVAVSYSPLFGQKLKLELGGDPSDFDHVFSPHETLVHEFVHVARDVSCNHKKLEDDEEELAVLITNIYSLEINRPVINNYDDQQPVTANLPAFSTRIYKEKFDMIDAFFKQNRPLAAELARINVAFNPLRQYADENL